MEFREIQSDSELREFAGRFATFVVELPLQYLQGAVVTGLFERGVMVGGFAVVSRPPLRLLEVIPKHLHQDLNLLKTAGESEFVEVNGLWCDRPGNLKPPRQFWARLAQQILISGKRYLLLGYNADRGELKKLYRSPLVEMTPLYTGEAALAGTFPRWKIGYIDIHAMKPQWLAATRRTPRPR